MIITWSCATCESRGTFHAPDMPGASPFGPMTSPFVFCGCLMVMTIDKAEEYNWLLHLDRMLSNHQCERPLVTWKSDEVFVTRGAL